MKNISGLSVFTLTASIWTFALSLIGPFYVVFAQQIGGTIQNLGIAFGFLVFAQAITSYFIGKHSDKIGRRPFLIFTGYVNSLIFFLYTFVTTTFQLYIIQIFLGIAMAMELTISKAFLGDLTKKYKRGRQIGKYDLVVGIFGGIAIIIGGFLIGKFGFQIIFYLGSIFFFLATTLLFLIKKETL